MCSGRVSRGRYPWMTIRSKQWYTKTRKRSKSFAKVSIGRLLRRFGWIPKSSVRAADGINQSREQQFAFFASWRLGEKIREAGMTENAIAKEIVDGAFRIHTTLGPG